METIQAQIFGKNGSEARRTLKVASDDKYLALFVDGNEIDIEIRKLKALL